MRPFIVLAAVLSLVAPATATAAPIASAGYMPHRYAGGPDAAWTAGITLNRKAGATTITIGVTMPRLRKGRVVKIDRVSSTAHFDGATLVLDTPLPAFAALALQGHEDATENHLTRTTTVAPQRALERRVASVLGTDMPRTRWVGYRSRKEWVDDHPTTMDEAPAARWSSYTETMRARRTKPLTQADVDRYSTAALAREAAAAQATCRQVRDTASDLTWETYRVNCPSM